MPPAAALVVQLAKEAYRDTSKSQYAQATAIADQQMELLWRLCCRATHQQRTDALHQESESRAALELLEGRRHRQLQQTWNRCLVTWGVPLPALGTLDTPTVSPPVLPTMVTELAVPPVPSGQLSAEPQYCATREPHLQKNLICDAVNNLHFMDDPKKVSDGPPMRRRLPLTPTEWATFAKSLKLSLPPMLLTPAVDPLASSVMLFDVLDDLLPLCPPSRGARRPAPSPPHVRSAAQLKHRLRSLCRKASACGEPQPSTNAELTAAVGLHNQFLRVTRAADRFDSLAPTMKAYHRNPAKFSRAVLDGTHPNGPKEIMVSPADAEKFFRDAYSDNRNDLLPPPPPSTVSPSQPQVPFPQTKVTLSELRRVLRKKNSASAPGPDGIPYTLYKRCEVLQRILLQLYNDVIRTGRVPPSWGVANIVLIPKPSGIVDDVKELRPIALTNTVGKLFTAILSRRLEAFLRANEFWDATQKGFASATQGCLDHSFTVQLAAQDARSHQKSIAVAWLDRKNAFGSDSHKMVPPSSPTKPCKPTPNKPRRTYHLAPNKTPSKMFPKMRQASPSPQAHQANHHPVRCQSPSPPSNTIKPFKKTTEAHIPSGQQHFTHRFKPTSCQSSSSHQPNQIPWYTPNSSPPQ